jgi:predicted transcriptional regulator
MAREGKRSYFDREHFANRLKTAVEKKQMTHRQFQETYFSEVPLSTVRRWLYGDSMPKPEQMQVIVDIFGWNRVKRWLRFTFDTTSKKQLS